MITLRSWMTDCTRVNNTLSLSLMLMYVDALHSLTHVTAAPSVKFLLPLWWLDMAFLTSSMNDFCRKQKHTKLTNHLKCMMNELDCLNIRLINSISKQFTYYQSYTSDELSIWVEQSQDQMQDQLPIFPSPRIQALSCVSIIFQIAFFLAHFNSSPFTLCMLSSIWYLNYGK